MKKILKSIHNFLISLTIPFKVIRNFLFPGIIVLLYHRVFDTEIDPQLLCVLPENFKKQMLYLKDNYKILRISELLKCLKEKKVFQKGIVITFDDGYADNYEFALPILEKLRIPAAFFVCGGNIGKSEEFVRKYYRALSINELQKMIKSECVEIGGHTVNHTRLSALSKNEQRKEIEENKNYLEKIINKKILAFSYPYGRKRDYNLDTIEIVKNNYQIAFSNFPGIIRNNSHIYELPRFLIRDWDIEIFKRKIRNFFLTS